MPRRGFSEITVEMGHFSNRESIHFGLFRFYSDAVGDSGGLSRRYDEYY